MNPQPNIAVVSQPWNGKVEGCWKNIVGEKKEKMLLNSIFFSFLPLSVFYIQKRQK